MSDIPLPNMQTQELIVSMGKQLEVSREATTPDKAKHNPDSEYLRELLTRANLSQRKAAERIGVNERTMRDYLNSNHPSAAPYPVQFALECLAFHGDQ